jgi:hypothetical protein
MGHESSALGMTMRWPNLWIRPWRLAIDHPRRASVARGAFVDGPHQVAGLSRNLADRQTQRQQGGPRFRGLDDPLPEKPHFPYEASSQAVQALG